MSKQYYVENLSIETLAELTDEMIRFRKNKKSNLNLLKIIPVAAAAIVLFIGVINILSILINNRSGFGGPGSNTEVNPATITIKGVEYSTDLTELALDSAELTDADIEPLKYMVNLTELSLWSNQISDISALAGLKNLTVLSLGDNRISDINPLAGLTNLTHYI